MTNSRLMSGSSDKILAGVSPGQIRVLLDILRDNAWRSRAFVEDRFRERARNFSETLRFLQQLGWIHAEGPELQVFDGWMERASADGADGAAVALLDALLDSPGRHQQEFARYLWRFQSADGVVAYAAPGGFDISDAPTRDFLMELGAVRHEPSRKEYVLQRPFLDAYMWALARKGPGTHAKLIEDLEERHRLGHQAEVAVLEFERQRLGVQWANRVRHVASDHPTAPYDIKSLTVTNGRPAPRYIEVKAISAAEPEFYWSAPEIEAARLLRREYYLYLLPVRGTGDLDLTQLQMIADPYSEIYSQPAIWEIQPTNYLCHPARIQTL